MHFRKLQYCCSTIVVSPPYRTGAHANMISLLLSCAQGDFCVVNSPSIEDCYLSKSYTMTPPAAKRRRAVEHHESVRNIMVVKGGLSIMCPSVSFRYPYSFRRVRKVKFSPDSVALYSSSTYVPNRL